MQRKKTKTELLNMQGSVVFSPLASVRVVGASLAFSLENTIFSLASLINIEADL